MEQVGDSFLTAFSAEVQSSPQLASSVGFFRTVGLDHIIHSVLDLGRTVLEEFSSTLADVFEVQEAEEFLQQTNRGIQALL